MKLIRRIDEIHKRFEDQVLKRNTAIRQNREFSTTKLAALRQEFVGSDIVASCGLHTVGIAGSFGRRDACDESDIDDMAISIVQPADDAREARNNAYTDWITGICEKHSLKRSNPKGIFRDIVAKDQVLQFAGDMNERYQDFSRRILLILESTWLYDQEKFMLLRDDIVNQYSTDIGGANVRKNFVFLLNDVIRYFRTICVNYQYTKEGTERGKWPLRNTKLRHSRVLMYFSMVACIGALSKYYEKDKVDVLKRLVALDPLARLHVVYELFDDSAFYRIAQHYNAFLAILNQKSSRDELIGLEYVNRYSSSIFAALKANSDGMSSELLRFFRARSSQWDERFFEYMII